MSDTKKSKSPKTDRGGRYRFSRHDCVKGGRHRAMQADFKEMCFLGFEAIAHKHGMQAALAIVHKRSGKRKKAT